MFHIAIYEKGEVSFTYTDPKTMMSNTSTMGPIAMFISAQTKEDLNPLIKQGLREMFGGKKDIYYR
jgi:hypothetical protein